MTKFQIKTTTNGKTKIETAVYFKSLEELFKYETAR